MTCQKHAVTESAFVRDAIQKAMDDAQESIEWLAYKCRGEKREPAAIVEGRTYQEACRAARDVVGSQMRIELVPRREAYKPHLAVLEEKAKGRT